MTHAEYEARFADTSARDALSNARAVLEKALAELDHYITRYEDADGLTNKADIVNWTINHLTTYIAMNVRLDTLAGAQAALARANALR